MGPVGIPEMIGIFLVALLLFGPKKLPELGRTLGKALSEFRRAKSELKSTFESHLHELERETRVDLNTPKLESPSYTPSTYTPSTYSYPYEDGSDYGSTSTPYGETGSPAAIEPVAPVTRPVEGTIARSNGATPVAADAPAAVSAPAPPVEERPA